MAAIAAGRASTRRSAPTRIWWWSVPNSRATRSENANSSPSRSPASGKPIENVARCRWPARASSATMIEESSPPDSSTPTGTSATIRRSTATRRASSSASAHSSSPHAARSGSRAKGGSHQRRSRRRPSGSSTSSVAGGSLRHAAQDRARGRDDGVEGEVVVQRDGIDGGVDAAARHQRGQRGREAQAAVRALAQVQRLDAEAVAGEHHPARWRARAARRRTCRPGGRAAPPPTPPSP